MFKPIHDRVLIRPSDAEDTTPGGIVIPAAAKEKPIEGRVVSVGPGRRLEDGSLAAMSVATGDRVLFSKYAGTVIRIEGVEHLIVREDEILGVY
jgi:chaperonin GroES